MKRAGNRCRVCGATVSIKERFCSKCGKEIHQRRHSKDYSGVLHQQGRVEIDDDWDEGKPIRREAKAVSKVRCESCGVLNKHSQLRCRNCSASL